MTRLPILPIRTLLLGLGLLMSIGCDHYSEFAETYARLPGEEDLTCKHVCESVVTSDHCEDVIACEDTFSENGDPAVVCVVEYYDPPELS